MQKALVKELLGPLVRRLGTAVGVFLVAQGWDADAVTQFVTASTAFGLVLVDLALSWLSRR